jgi:hypothetical protein
MKQSIVEAIVRAAKDNDREDEVWDYGSYSGRGMFGLNTHALVATSLTAMASVVALACLGKDQDFVEQVACEMSEARVDNLGRDYIVY